MTKDYADKANDCLNKKAECKAIKSIICFIISALIAIIGFYVFIVFIMIFSYPALIILSVYYGIKLINKK